MKLTIRYTLWISIIFVGVFLITFYLISMRMNSIMLESTSNTLQRNALEVKNLAENTFKFLPYMAVNQTAESSQSWLESKTLYFGSSSSEVMLNFEYDWTDKGAFINFKGLFGMFEIYRAKVNLHDFFSDIINQLEKDVGYFYVLDPMGNTVYHTIKSRNGKNIIDAGLGEIFKRFKSKRKGFIDYEYNGEKIRVFFETIKFPWKVYYYDRSGNERELVLYVGNALTMEDIRRIYSPFLKFIHFVLFPVMLGVVIVASYFTSIFATKNLKKQNDAIKAFSKDVADTAMNISTSSAEIEKIAENNESISMRLNEITQNFATSVEEGRYEVDNSVKSIMAFLDLLEKVSEEISKAVDLIESLNDLNERVAYLSDTVSVLAINASIESAKEKIDREGIAKIVEHITKISKESRETSKETKKIIDKVQKSLSQLALYSEKVEKEGKAIRAAIENVSQVMENFVSGIGQIRDISENLTRSSSEINAGVEEIVQSLSELQSSLDRLSEMIREVKI